ncbi:MAG: leucine-rich repeat domain-containing protein [Bacillota bacterium]|nr:leucine-rich repeat domain-containing protein [Bacillota bacterium]
MFKTKFTNMLRQYPKCLENKTVFASYMKDLFPEEKLMTHILTSLIEVGIIDEIRSSADLDMAFSFRYTKNLVENFGYNEEKANDAVYIWCDCYGREILGKQCSFKPAKPKENSSGEKGKLYQDLFQYRVFGEKGIVTGCSDQAAKTLVIPNKVSIARLNVIDEAAFRGMNSLEQVVITNGYTEIGKSAFAECSNLKQIILPYSINSIGEEAFSNCKCLDTLNIPESTFSIGRYALSSTAIKEFKFPVSVVTAGKGLFKDCRKLSKVVFNNSQTEIPDEMFWGCENLKHIKIPENIKMIGNMAFAECKSLIQLSIPDSVIEIADQAFADASEDLVIICSMGSEAERFARSKRIKYQLM